jgi:hypothetical protein
MPMTVTILRNGAIAGLIAGGALLVTMIFFYGRLGDAAGMAVGYLTMLVALSFVLVAVRQEREARGGAIGFWPALGIGLAVSAIAGVFYDLAWELTLAITGRDFARDFAEMMIRAARDAGKTGPALDAAMAEARAFEASYRNPLYRMAMTFTEIFPVGVLVSLVSAALLRRSRFLPARRVAA